MENELKKKSGLATAGMVLGIIGVCTSFIPIINNMSFVLGILAVVFGIVTLIKKASLGKTIAALILGILAIVFTVSSQASLSNSINNAIEDFNDDMGTITGEKTDEILKDNLDIEIGEFTVTKNGYFEETKLPVRLTNKGSEKASFSITIEALAENGDRLKTDYIYANDLGAGQSQNFETFAYVEQELKTAFKTAKFNIVEVSMY